MGVGGSTVIPGISIWQKQCLRDGVGFRPVPLQNLQASSKSDLQNSREAEVASRRTEAESVTFVTVPLSRPGLQKMGRSSWTEERVG